MAPLPPPVPRQRRGLHLIKEGGGGFRTGDNQVDDNMWRIMATLPQFGAGVASLP